jgi:hypothetical protein
VPASSYAENVWQASQLGGELRYSGDTRHHSQLGGELRCSGDAGSLTAHAGMTLERRQQLKKQQQLWQGQLPESAQKALLEAVAGSSGGAEGSAGAGGRGIGDSTSPLHLNP